MRTKTHGKPKVHNQSFGGFQNLRSPGPAQPCAVIEVRVIQAVNDASCSTCRVLSQERSHFVTSSRLLNHRPAPLHVETASETQLPLSSMQSDVESTLQRISSHKVRCDSQVCETALAGRVSVALIWLHVFAQGILGCIVVNKDGIILKSTCEVAVTMLPSV